MSVSILATPLSAVFLLASLLLAVTPGPAVFYIVTRSITQGRRAGLASVAGVALGNLGNASGAALGLAALFAVSAIAFTIVKYAGAAYLVYLGIQTLRRRQEPVATKLELGSADVRRIFRDGFIVALLNPKTALFFAAFLPQFMVPGTSTALQSVVLGSTFVVIASITDTMYALTASAIAPALTRASPLRVAGRWLTAGAFVGLGVFTALSGNRSAK
ncbi:MAG: LysE family translocator [Burkholderiales bacterium]|nr:LysE family translocator [Burkholderiales bacterium]